MISKDEALEAALRAAKTEAGDVEEEELEQLLEECAGEVMGDTQVVPFYRYAFAAADFLYSDPDRLAKAQDGLTFTQVIDAVVSLLRRQVRLDAAPGVVIPDALSAQKLLDEVLAASGKAPVQLRRASLQAI